MSAYELRIYKIADGKLNAIEANMRELVAPLLQYYAMQAVGYWATPDNAKLVWLVRHDSLDVIASNWDRFHADPRWTKGLAERQQGERFVTDIESMPLLVIPTLPPSGSDD